MSKQESLFSDQNLLRTIKNSLKSNYEVIEQLKFLKFIISKLTIAIYIHDLPKENHIWTNGNYQNILGFTNNEVLLLRPEWSKNYLHPEDQYVVDERLNFFRENMGDVYSGMYRIMHKEGHWVWLYSVCVSFQRYKNKQTEKVLGFCLDLNNNFRTTKQLDEFYYMNNRKKTEKEIINLTPREMEIIRLINRGKTCRIISDELNISIHTANNHRKNILRKLGLKNIAELAHYASIYGLT